MPKRDEYSLNCLYKARKLLDCILKRYRNIEQDEADPIDEQIVPTKSKSSLWQYLSNKTHKWDIKVLVRCAVLGIVYGFSVYVGQQDATDATSIMFGKIGAAVIRLVENLSKNVGHKLYMKNLFTSILLLKHLKLQGS